jgi:hypothetical protein
MKIINYALSVLLVSTGLFAQIDIGNGWLTSGDIRAGWLEYDYSNSAGDSNTNKGHKDSQGFYIMPKVSILSPKYNGFSFKSTVAGATDFGMNNHDDESRNFVFDGADNESFAILQELYVSYENEGHTLLLGRNELTTPMIDTDDWYMLANSFELAYYSYSDIPNITLSAVYFYKMSGVWDSGDNGTEFHSMSDASFVDSADKKRADDSGVATLAFLYNDDKNNNLQVWNYYATDLYNTLFIQYDWTDKISAMDYDFGVQFINFKEVGELKDHNTTNIDYSLYSARFDANFDNGISVATGYSKYTDGDGQGATLGAFGGYPYFANGMIFHFFEAGSLRNAQSAKVQLGFDLSKIGIADTRIFYRYTNFNLDDEYSISSNGKSQDEMILNGVRISYANKNGIYFTGTYESVDLDNEPSTYSLRLIGGYKF